jgi:uncharacterized protein YkwD
MKVSRLQRFSALVLAVTLAAPLSLVAETRTPRRTSLSDLARDLEQALGRGSVSVTGARTPQRTSPRADASSLSAQTLVDEMNRERAAKGMSPLRLNSQLSAAAGDRVSDMFDNEYFDHVAPDGTSPFTWVDKRGYRYSVIGENLAVGYPTSARVVGGWMSSPGHRANILKRDFDEIGIAVASGAPIRGYSGPLVVAMYAAR